MIISNKSVVYLIVPSIFSTRKTKMMRIMYLTMTEILFSALIFMISVCLPFFLAINT
jgi:hypothetical protein